ncbi:MAG: hypothetical protein ACLRPV_05625 [Lacrimispora saccharolytica]
MANTARDKSDRLYFIVIEAHPRRHRRGVKRDVTYNIIMQKFLKGSPSDGIEAMPVVIGMSATSARFNALVQGIASDTQYVVVTTDEVRASGLLKDRIVISYPEKLRKRKGYGCANWAAADEWKDKWDHWYQSIALRATLCLCESNFAIIQVQECGIVLTRYLRLIFHDCVQKIEGRTGDPFPRRRGSGFIPLETQIKM